MNFLTGYDAYITNNDETYTTKVIIKEKKKDSFLKLNVNSVFSKMVYKKIKNVCALLIICFKFYQTNILRSVFLQLIFLLDEFKK